MRFSIHCLFLLVYSYSFYLPAQVIDSFDTADLLGWYSEGDGEAVIDTTFGNPGGSLLVDDFATGQINIAIAPNRYIGDWSAANSEDSITAEYYVDSSDPDELEDEDPVFEISGPGGRAIALKGLQIARNQWVSVGVSMDSSDWDILSGDWLSLLQQVDLLKVRVEFINGQEDTYLDNFGLSFTPAGQLLRTLVCSDFENGTAEGWKTFNAGAVGVDSSYGNPGLGLGINDRGAVTSELVAPPKFLGEWELTDSARLSFDLRLDRAGSGPLFDVPYLVRLTGLGASAFVRPADSLLMRAVNEWYTYDIELSESAWTVTEGNWADLIANVTEIRLTVEFITGDDDARFDNFCIDPGRLPTSIANLKKVTDIEVFPNPSNGRLTVSLPDKSIDRLTVYDLTGRVLFRNTPAQTATTFTVDYRGTAMLRVDAGSESYSTLVVLQGR